MSFLYNAFKNAPAIGKKIKSTITGMKPKGGKTDTRAYKENLMQKRLSKNKDEMIEFRNQKSKELFKNK